MNQIKIDPPEKMTPPLFIRREVPPVIYKDQDSYQASTYLPPLPEEGRW
jgi:hypothetical protein